MKLKYACAVLAAFVGGTYAQYKFDKASLKKEAPGLIRKATDATWSQAFKAGYDSAVEDPSVRYKHYLEFKEYNKEE